MSEENIYPVAEAIAESAWADEAASLALYSASVEDPDASREYLREYSVTMYSSRSK